MLPRGDCEGGGERGEAYATASDHLTGEELDVPFVLIAAPRLASGEDVAEIVEEEARVPAECQACVFVLFDQFSDVEVVFTVLA